jgi:outer membrane protein insertion porin family
MKTSQLLISVILFLLLYVAAQAVSQSSPIVRAIEIHGLETIAQTEVMGVLTTRVGDAYDPAKRSEDVKAINRLGYFKPASVSADTIPYEDGVKVIFTVEENPIVGKISIAGAKKIPTARVRSVLPVREGRLWRTQAVYEIQQSVERMYRDAGFHEIKVWVETEQRSDGKLDVRVTIDEGTKILIKDVIFRGNKSISGWRLRWHMLNRGSWAFFKKYFDYDTFQDDLEIIRMLYQSKGFLDVRVSAGEPLYNEKKGWICPVVEISEGLRYRVDQIIVKNATVFAPDEIAHLFSRMKGRFLDFARLGKALDKVYRMYGDEGYIDLEVTHDFEKNVAEGTVDIVLTLTEHERVYVGKVEPRIETPPLGMPEELTFIDRFYAKIAPPVSVEVVKREIRLKPGAVYRRFEEVRTRERLKNLGIFDDVAIWRQPTDKPNVRDVVVSVKEGDTGNLLFDIIGYNEEIGLFTGVRYIERNLFGDARVLRLSFQLGTRATSFYAGYLDRYFRNTTTSFRIDAYKDTFDRRKYDEDMNSLAVEFGRPLNEYLQAYLRLRAGYVQFNHIDDDVVEKLNQYPLGTVRFRLVDDHRDNILWPTAGYRRSAGIELGYADGLVAKLTSSYSWYWKVYGDVVYALNLEAGMLPYDAEKVGITERFFLGGTEDLRGFRFRGAGPKDPGENDMAIGGSTKVLIQNELRYPIYKSVKGVVFVDAGTLDREAFELDSLRLSTGLGIRLEFPILYLSLDFAKALLKEDEDDTCLIHFKIGSTF